MKLGSTPRQFTLLVPSFEGSPKVSLEGSVAPPPPLFCSHSQERCILSPLFATLTHSASRKSFPCHSCENTGDGISSRRLLLGSTGSPLATRHSPLAWFPLFARSFALSFLATSAESAHYALFQQNTRDIRPKSEHPAKVHPRDSGGVHKDTGAGDVRPKRGEGSASLRAGASPDPVGVSPWPIPPIPLRSLPMGTTCCSMLLPTSKPLPGGAIDANG
jgi:hypothetical protein